MTKLTWFEQTNFGLIDVSMVCDEGTSFRFTNNEAGLQTSPKICVNGFSFLQSQYQANYGIINARMKCVGSEEEADDVNSNYKGVWDSVLSCISGDGFTGLEVREHEGYGIVNVKIACSLYTEPGECNLYIAIQCYLFHLKPT